MIGKALIAIVLTGILWGCTTSSQHGSKTQGHKGQAPVIVDYYAVKDIRPGATWKLYLRAQDKDRDMEYIGVLLYQQGMGYHPTSETWIKEKDRAEFAGYVVLVTPPDPSLIGSKLELTAVVWDMQENSSKVLNLQLTFKYVSADNIPEKWQLAAKHKLGTLMIDIPSSVSLGQ